MEVKAYGAKDSRCQSVLMGEIQWVSLKFEIFQARAVVAYGCLFSGLRYICNTCTQVADRYITLILRK